MLQERAVLRGCVAVFEDDADVLLLLELLLRNEGYLVYPCASYDELVEICGQVQPDLVVTDTWGASTTVLESCEREALTELAARVPTILTTGCDWAVRTSPAALGLTAVFVKPYDGERLMRACNAAAADFLPTRAVDPRTRPQVPPSTSRGDFGPDRHRGVVASQQYYCLTHCEREILQLLASGATTNAVAKQLGLAIVEVRAHVQNILATLRVQSKLEAVLTAIRIGEIREPRPESPMTPPRSDQERGHANSC